MEPPHHKSSSTEELEFPEYAKTAFFCLPQRSKPRYWLLKLITWAWFEKITMSVILLNCITMGMQNPLEGDDCNSRKCLIVKRLDDAILVYFVFEMLVKIMAMGFVGKKTYLSQSWNILDFFIVIAGLLEIAFASKGSGITAIRTFRVLRPLRAINKVPSLRIIVSLIIDSLPMLANVIILGLLIFTVFAILGVQLWKGLLRYRCFETGFDTLNNTVEVPFYRPAESDFICSLGSGLQTCLNIPNSNASQYECRPSNENPFQGAISFDNAAYAFIAIFQIITLENWIPLMHYIQDAHSFYNWIFFAILIVLGSFCLLNMFVVVISVQFSVTKENENKVMAVELKKERELKAASDEVVVDEPVPEQIGALEAVLIACGELILGLVEKVYKVKRSNIKHVERGDASNTTSLKLLLCCCFGSVARSRPYSTLFKMRRTVRKFVDDKPFQNFIVTAIFINSVFMAIEHHNQSQLLTNVTDYSNYVFTLLFFMEMTLKMFGYGLFGYIKDPLNLFDGFIVAISIYELVGSSGSSGLSVLRTFRLLRILKLFRFIPVLRKQVEIMFKTFANVAAFCVLFVLFIFIFSILGMNLFGGKFYTVDSSGEIEYERKNFDSLFWAAITVFQILTHEDWNEVLYNAMEKTNAWSFIYFMVLILFGKYILMSLLIAIITDGFSDKDDEEEDKDLKVDAVQQEKIDTYEVKTNDVLTDQIEPFLPNNEPVVEPQAKEDEPKKSNCCSSFLESDNSFFIFSKSSSIRKLCINIMKQPFFDQMILLTIFLNCITLALERPNIDPDSCERKILSFANDMFTIIFTVEMLIKATSLGFILGKDAYLKNSWNVLDFFLVSVSLIDVIISMLATGNAKILSLLRVFRIMRTLRPLRAINSAPGLKLVVNSLITSLGLLGNTAVICASFFLIFAILGVQLFKGKMYRCEGDDLAGVLNKTNCVANPDNKWVNSAYNYDNILNSLLTLFIVSTADGWVDIMYEGIDAVGIDQQPVKNHNEYMAFFYIIFLLLVGMFIIDMFVGVIVDNFQENRARQLEEQALIRKNKPKVEKVKTVQREVFYFDHYTGLRRKVHNLVSNTYFDIGITSIILLNVLTMLIEHYEMTDKFILALEITNYIFTTIFVIEAILRLYAFGLKRYFSQGWNQLDCFIVVVSVASIFIDIFLANSDFKMPIDPTLIRIIRIVRIARILKVFKTAKGIISLLNTVSKALPQVGNIGLLLVLLFFIFATLGVELFGKLSCDIRFHECGGINRYTNFNNVGAAFLTLFRMITGDNWNAIMKDAMHNNIVCYSNINSTDIYVDIYNVEDLQLPCINSYLTPFYFIMFTLTGQFILMNLVIAVLMNQLEESSAEAQDDEDKQIIMDIEMQEIKKDTQSITNDQNLKDDDFV